MTQVVPTGRVTRHFDPTPILERSEPMAGPLSEAENRERDVLIAGAWVPAGTLAS